MLAIKPIRYQHGEPMLLAGLRRRYALVDPPSAILAQ